jgi:hypothetical protein
MIRAAQHFERSGAIERLEPSKSIEHGESDFEHLNPSRDLGQALEPLSRL